MPVASLEANRPVFADSFAFIALLNPSGAYYSTTARLIGYLSRGILTTHWVAIEVANALSTTNYRVEVARLLRDLSQHTGTEIVGLDKFYDERRLNLHDWRPDKTWMDFLVIGRAQSSC